MMARVSLGHRAQRTRRRTLLRSVCSVAAAPGARLLLAPPIYDVDPLSQASWIAAFAVFSVACSRCCRERASTARRGRRQPGAFRLVDDHGAWVATPAQ
jgi:hypothetical protein